LVKAEKDADEGQELSFWLHTFAPCPPISTYIYNVCAGEYDVIVNDDATAPTPMKILLRNSKINNIDAKELFRVISNGIRFFEKFIGVPFPFEKYD
jgi:aminopeptidase N